MDFGAPYSTFGIARTTNGLVVLCGDAHRPQSPPIRKRQNATLLKSGRPTRDFHHLLYLHTPLQWKVLQHLDPADLLFLSDLSPAMECLIRGFPKRWAYEGYFYFRGETTVYLSEHIDENISVRYPWSLRITRNGNLRLGHENVYTKRVDPKNLSTDLTRLFEILFPRKRREDSLEISKPDWRADIPLIVTLLSDKNREVDRN
ncbi:unnamed protein product, partial [Mesorhabditis spiculigera]